MDNYENYERIDYIADGRNLGGRAAHIDKHIFGLGEIDIEFSVIDQVFDVPGPLKEGVSHTKATGKDCPKEHGAVKGVAADVIHEREHNIPLNDKEGVVQDHHDDLHEELSLILPLFFDIQFKVTEYEFQIVFNPH